MSGKLRLMSRSINHSHSVNLELYPTLKKYLVYVYLLSPTHLKKQALEDYFRGTFFYFFFPLFGVFFNIEHGRGN